MNILSRHLFMSLMRPLLCLLLAFTLLFVIADLMNHGDDFYAAGSPAKVVLRYYSLQLPALVIVIVPICLLLATLYSLCLLTRHSEIVAMSASGVGILRIARPYLQVGFLCFAATALVNEYIGPEYSWRARQIVESQRRSSDAVYFESIPYRNHATGHTWYIENFDTRTSTMQGITLRQQRPDGTDITKITAKKGYWLDRRWWLEDVTVQRFDAGNNLDGLPETFHIKEMRDLPETPEDFLGEAKGSRHLSSLQLWKYIQTHGFLSPKTIGSFKVDLHHKLAMPFTCLIATLIGIPVGTHTGYNGTLAGVLLSIGMFFGFYAVQFTMEYLAKQLIIPPWVGAWSSIILFAAIGAIMIYRMR